MKKKEILSEIDQSNLNRTEQGLKIQEIINELATYKVGDPTLDEEIRILFPEITAISFGSMQNYATSDSVGLQKLILYIADKPIDENKMKIWMQKKLEVQNLLIIKK